MSVRCLVLTGQPCALSALTGPETFEVHLTTVPLGAEGVLAYRRACLELKVKAIVIELAPGVPVQPMTCMRVTGTVQDAHDAARRVGDQLSARGFPTRRLKIEAAPWNPGVPRTDDDASAEPTGRYFEFHARVLLEEGTDLAVLAGRCADHGAHLSRNPLKVRDDGRQERFVTLRCPGVGLATTESRAAALLHDLAASGWTVASSVLEYCVYDDHLELDAGWGTPTLEVR